MDTCQLFSSNEQEDKLRLKKLQESVMESHPDPDRIGCIDHSTLETLVNSPEKLDLSDPKFLHVLKCAMCTWELIELRVRRSERATHVPVQDVSKAAEN